MKKHEIKYKGQMIIIYERDDGSGIDRDGTIYPNMFDKGFCGVSPLETGEIDPWWQIACKPHDDSFNRAKAGYANPNESNWTVFKDFSGTILSEMLSSAYKLISGPVYILFGGVLGAARYRAIRRR